MDCDVLLMTKYLPQGFSNPFFPLIANKILWLLIFPDDKYFLKQTSKQVDRQTNPFILSCPDQEFAKEETLSLTISWPHHYA